MKNRKNHSKLIENALKFRKIRKKASYFQKIKLNFDFRKGFFKLFPFFKAFFQTFFLLFLSQNRANSGRFQALEKKKNFGVKNGISKRLFGFKFSI